MKGVDEDGEKLSLSLGPLEPSRDLLKRFMDQPQFSNANDGKNNEGVDKDEELELSLGLSLNGIYGVDPTSKKLKRASSISNLAFTVGGVDCGEASGSHAPLFRASSLPTTKGKELVIMQQMEARQKRMKKMKNVRLVKDKENEINGVDVVVVDGFENGNVNVNGNGNGNGNGNVWPSSQGSMGSQGSGSSGFDDLQSQQIEVARQTAEVKSPSNQQAVPAQVEQRPATETADTNVHVANQLIKMPYVSLRGGAGNGNGNKTEGFLYRYNKGDDIRIVCVCHGLFLSPAEFVKHGGGGDVEYPLKHIVVNPSPLF